MGRIFTGIILVVAVVTSPLNKYFPGIYVYIQTLLSFFQGPTLAILVLGMFWSRTTQWGGLFGLLGGLCLSGTMYAFKANLFTINDPFLYISWWSFIGALIITTLVSLVTRPMPLEELRGLVYGMVLKDDKVQATLKSRAENS